MSHRSKQLTRYLHPTYYAIWPRENIVTHIDEVVERTQHTPRLPYNRTKMCVVYHQIVSLLMCTRNACVAHSSSLYPPPPPHTFRSRQKHEQQEWEEPWIHRPNGNSVVVEFFSIRPHHHTRANFRVHLFFFYRTKLYKKLNIREFHGNKRCIWRCLWHQFSAIVNK